MRWKCRECDRKCEIQAVSRLRPDKCPFDSLGFFTGPERWQKAKPKKRGDVMRCVYRRVWCRDCRKKTKHKFTFSGSLDCLECGHRREDLPGEGV